MARSSEHSSAQANLALSGENVRQKPLRLRILLTARAKEVLGGSARANLGLGLEMVPAPNLDWFEVQTSTKYPVMKNDVNMNPTM